MESSTFPIGGERIRSAFFSRPVPWPLLVAFVVFLATLAWSDEASAGQLNLSWVDGSGDALGFSVERSEDMAGPFAVIATTGPRITAYTDSAVADSTTYCYRVQAFNAVAYSEYSYPSCGTSAPAALTLSLDMNQDEFALEERFRLDITFPQIGVATAVDVYLGSTLPDALAPVLGCSAGDAIVYVVDAPAGLDGLIGKCASGEESNPVALYSRISADALPELMGPNFFSFDWPEAPPGDYTIFLTVTRAGTADVVAQATVTVRYLP